MLDRQYRHRRQANRDFLSGSDLPLLRWLPRFVVPAGIRLLELAPRILYTPHISSIHNGDLSPTGPSHGEDEAVHGRENVLPSALCA